MRADRWGDVTEQFRAAMAGVGIVTDDPVVPDGRLHRFRAEGDKRGSRNGWFVLHADDPPAGAFGHWRTGVSETWCAGGNGTGSWAEQKAFRARVEERKQRQIEEQSRRHQSARKKATRLWKQAKKPNSGHPYLATKAVSAHGVRQLGDALLVPVRGANGELRGLQRIFPNGTKRFLAGTEVTGGYHPIGTPDGTVIVAEGYATGASIHQITGHAVAVAFNAGNLAAVVKVLRTELGAEVNIILAADNDTGTEGNPGLTAATEAAKSVGGLVAVPTDELNDFNDLARIRGSDAVAGVIEAVLERAAIQADNVVEGERPKKVRQNDDDHSDEKPVIQIHPDLTGVTDEAIAALLARPDLGVYVRGRQLVRVARDGSAPVRWLKRWPGAPVIVSLGGPQVLDVLDRCATWMKYDGRGQKLVPALPPGWAGQQVAARLEWPLPYLEAVTETPTIRRDGSILDAPGWDEPTGLLYEPIPGAADWPMVAEKPNADDLESALATLKDPFVDFPFVAESDRAAAVAAMLTLVARHLIDGPTPLFPIRAPTPGTGKTLLAEIIGLIGTGRVPPTMTMTYDAEELRKRITSLAVEGAQVILLDNVSGTLGSNTLAAALTATEWEDRILGTNTVVRVPLRVVWMATGNNLGFRRTLGRRVVPIDLDAGVEQPEDRIGFRYPDLKAHVQRHRPKLVSAALTILRAHCQAGRPAHGGPRTGSFEAWDDTIRSAVIWLGLDDPASLDPDQGRGRVRSQADDDTETLGALLRALHDQWPDAPFTAADAIAAATRNEELQTALDLAATPSKGGKPTGRSLGYAFRSAVDRPIRGFVLRRRKQNVSGVLWYVESLDGGR